MFGLLAVGASILGKAVSARTAAKNEEKRLEAESEQRAKELAYQAEANKLDLNELVADAQAAGFNPSTVLGATGGQGFNHTPAQISATDFSVGSSTAGAVLSGVGDYFQQELRRKSERAEIELKKAQTTAIYDSLQSSPQIGYAGSNPSGPVRQVQTPTRRYVTDDFPSVTDRPSGAFEFPAATFGGASTPDMTVYNSMGDPLELETWSMGAAVSGELPDALYDIGFRNYPRTTRAIAGLNNAGAEVFDAGEAVIDALRGGQGFEKRTLPKAEQEKLKGDSWLYRNLGISITLQ